MYVLGIIIFSNAKIVNNPMKGMRIQQEGRTHTRIARHTDQNTRKKIRGRGKIIENEG